MLNGLQMTWRTHVVTAGVCLLTAGHASAGDIVVPAGFAVDVLLDQIDGTVPRLEAIRNPDYGFGVMTAAINNGVLTVQRISAGSVEVFGTETGFSSHAVKCIRFDTTGLFKPALCVSVVYTAAYSGATQFFGVWPDGSIAPVTDVLGGPSNELGFIFDFTTDAHGYIEGAYLEDQFAPEGTDLWHMAPDFSTSILAENHLPPGRPDLDIRGMEFDPTGVYNNWLILADTDEYHDEMAAIYGLKADLTWETIAGPVHHSVRYYRDMTISPGGGAFDPRIYVTDLVTQGVITVAADGTHESFASGFAGVLSLTASSDGNYLYVSDANGIYRIRSETSVPGPTIIMREPKVVADDVHTGPSGVSWERILFNEAVTFTSADVAITDSAMQPVQFSVSGSNSQIMLISLGEVLLNDVYTITIADTVVSVATGDPIDGDNDGQAGGDAVIVMEHRCRPDADNDGTVGILDLLALLANWGKCP